MWDENTWRGGNGWRIGDRRDGGSLTGLHYHYSGPATKWDVWIIGLVFVGTFGIIIWTLWDAWKNGGSGNAVPVPAKESCWQITLPIGPIYVGYGCKGWFWNVGGYSDGFDF
jgi:hypothetical protein